MIDPAAKENTEKVTDKQNYQLAVQSCIDLRKRLQESIQEKEDMMNRITMLNQELRLQETHFSTEKSRFENDLRRL